MSGVLLPVCSIFFSLLLLLAYFLKKRYPLIENKVYSVMLVASFIDSILVSVLQAICLVYPKENIHMFISVFNKIDFGTIIVFSSCIFLYIMFITRDKNKENYEAINYICSSWYVFI